MDLFKAFKHPEAQVASNPFDLSFRNVLTTKAGTLRPILCKEVVPGDKWKISLASLLRTFPMQTAAFLRCKQNFDFFFVPYQQLWSGWESFISQREDPVISKPDSTAQGSTVLPHLGSLYLKTRLETIATTQYTDFTGFNGINSALTLLSDLGYGTGAMHYDDADNFSAPLWFSNTNKLLNAFPLMAYHKIFYDFYSNPDYTSVRPEFFNADAADFNHGNDMINYLDYYFGNDTRKFDFFLPHQRTYKKDLFTSVLPNQQFGLVSGVTSSDFDLYTSVTPTGERNITVGTDRKVDINNVTATKFNSGNNSLFDVLTLRRAEALQVWKEKTLRAGRRYKAQQNAHFGVESKFTAKSHAVRIGSFDSLVNVDEVIATSNGTADGKNSLIGEIAGKGISASNNGTIDFEASDFGILMCIYSVVPEADYLSEGVDKLVMKSFPFDFYTPEFANLGLHPIESVEISTNNAIDSSHDSYVWGYAPAYYEYKTSVDKVQADTYGDASLLPWTSVRQDFLGSRANALTERDLYINPNVLDNIFGRAANPYPDTDQFITAVQFNLNVLRKMSVIGTPQYM